MARRSLDDFNSLTEAPIELLDNVKGHVRITGLNDLCEYYFGLTYGIDMNECGILTGDIIGENTFIAAVHFYETQKSSSVLKLLVMKSDTFKSWIDSPDSQQWTSDIAVLCPLESFLSKENESLDFEPYVSKETNGKQSTFEAVVRAGVHLIGSVLGREFFRSSTDSDDSDDAESSDDVFKGEMSDDDNNGEISDPNAGIGDERSDIEDECQ